MSIFGGYGGVRGYKSSSDQSSAHDLSEYAKRSYVDAAIQGISAPDLSNYVKKTSDSPLDMDGHRITNIPKPSHADDAVSAGLVREVFEKLEGDMLLADGSKAMTSHLDLAGHRIQNVGLPRNSTDAANRDYVDIRVGQVIGRIKPIISVIAEERGSLIGGEFEWSFGSNSDGRDHSKVGYVMMAKGRILRMSLSAAGSNGLSEDIVVVGITVNGNFKQGYEVTKASQSYSAKKTFHPPLELEDGDIINFQTRDSARRTTAGVIALLIELEL